MGGILKRERNVNQKKNLLTFWHSVNFSSTLLKKLPRAQFYVWSKSHVFLEIWYMVEAFLYAVTIAVLMSWLTHMHEVVEVKMRAHFNFNLIMMRCSESV